MLPHLIAWQKQHFYPMQFACEATLNIAKQTEILRLMREASFGGRVRRHRNAGGRGAQSHAQGSEQFAADDRRDQDAQRLRPGGERPASSSGSTPTATIPRRGSRISSSCPNVPMLTINLLQALPKTPLWDRLKQRRTGLNDDPQRESNVVFRRPYDEVVAMWRRCIEYANEPERLFARFAHQIEATYANRLVRPGARQAHLEQSEPRGRAGVQRGRSASAIEADYRRWFWRAARRAAPRPDRRGAQYRHVGHHMIPFSREALRGEQNASFYSAQTRRSTVEAPPPAFAKLRKSG